MPKENTHFVVYVKVNEKNHVVGINSDAFLEDLTGWIRIAEGAGVKHHHAQGNFTGKPLFDDRGIARYELKDGKIHERKKPDMDAEFNSRPVPASDSDRLEKVEKVLRKLCEHLGVSMDD